MTARLAPGRPPTPIPAWAKRDAKVRDSITCYNCGGLETIRWYSARTRDQWGYELSACMPCRVSWVRFT